MRGGELDIHMSTLAVSELHSGSNVTTYFSLLVLNRPVI